MKILHIAPDPSAKNGIGKYSAFFETALRSVAVDVEVLYLVERRESLWNLSRFIREMGSADYDVIHIEIGVGTNLTFYSLLLIWILKKNIPVVVTLHDPPLVLFSPSLGLFGYKPNGILNKILRKLILDPFFNFVLLKRVMNVAKCIVVLNREAEKTTQLYFLGTRVLYCPLLWYQRELLDGDLRRIIFYGFLAPAKGVEELILALSTLKGNCENVVLDVVGGCLNDDYKNELVELVRREGLLERVVFHGYVSDDKFDLISRGAGIAVFPYRTTASLSASAAIVDCMAHGKLIVCSDIKRLRGEFSDGSVLFYQGGNVDDLVEKIKFLLTNLEDVQELRKSAEVCLERRHPRVVAEKFLSIYKNVLFKSSER